MRRPALIALLLMTACGRDPELARLQELNLKAQLENRRIEECRETIVQLDRQVARMRTELAEAAEMYRRYRASMADEDK